MNQQNERHSRFNELVKPHLRSLRNTAFRLAKDEMESEDILQETLYKAYKGFSTFTPNTNFRAWIFRILVNTYLTSYRKRVRQPQKVSYNDLEEFYLYQKTDNPEDFYAETPDTVSGEMFEDEVKESLEKIPYYFRLIVMLYDIEGFSYNDISKIVNIPVCTVMSRLNRGRSLLRKKLKNYARQKGYQVDSELDMRYLK